MRLWITEKPSIAKELAAFFKAKRESGYYTDGKEYIVACYGHMLELPSPDEMDEKWQKWNYESLPILPTKWNLKIRNDKGVKAAMQTIKTLLQKTTTVVNVGDPDREGQLLVDEVLDFYKNTKPVKRLWLTDMNELPNEINKMKDNSYYNGFKIAAQARQRGDFIVGMTFTRALTLKMREYGYEGVFSAGRVQTPVLRLIVDRYNDVENFKSIDYFEMDGFFDTKNIKAKLFNPLHFNAGYDSENRLIDRSYLDNLQKEIDGKTSEVLKCKNQPKYASQPLLFNLGKLQSVANSKLGFSAQKTLDVAQKLYENKYTTYPRTDCQYVPTSLLDNAETVLSKLALNYELAKGASAKVKSPSWDDKKVGAHYAIIPTGKGSLSSLSEDEKKLYDLIALQYITQFYPRHEFDQVDLEFQVESNSKKYLFKAKGIKITSIGWKKVLGKEENEEEIDLPSYNVGDKVKLNKTVVNAKKTTPPDLYTEGTLVEALENIDKVVDRLLKDSSLPKEEIDNISKEYKNIFKFSVERGTKPGIGTEATRANIIETLKSRNYIELKKKFLIPSPKGMLLIKSIISTPQATKKLQFLSSPLTTAKYEKFLGEMALDNKSDKDFFDELAKDVSNATNFGELKLEVPKFSTSSSSSFTSGKTSSSTTSKTTKKATGNTCPKCKQGTLIKRTGVNGPFWACNKYPECKTTFKDEKGKPKLN